MSVVSRPPGAVIAALTVALAAGLGRPEPAAAQRVLLQLRPHVGDTLHMRVDQQVDLTGTGRRSGGDSVSSSTTTSFALARIIVERSDTGGADVLVVVDSMAQSSSGGRGSRSSDGGPRAPNDRRVRVHMAPDGVPTVTDSLSTGNPEVRALLGGVPATLPHDPIRVGQTWERTMAAPPGTAYPGPAEIRLQFCLDSVSGSRDSAYISVRGALGKGRFPPSADGATVTTWGTVAGTMLIDRHRGWLTDSHAIISVHSVFTPPPGTGHPAVRMRMTVTEWFRTVDRP